MRAAVVGHVEWIEFVPVEAVPRPGEIVHADESWEQAAGGGSVAAVQLAQLADSVDFFTVLGNDEPAQLARAELEARGVTVHAASVEAPQRSGFTFIDDTGERTITTIGRKLHPRGHDESLPWHELARCDAVYFCAGDADAVLLARRARVLVATARELSTLRQASVELDVLVSSGKDEAERYHPGQLDPEPRIVVTTSGALGGWAQPGGPYQGGAASARSRRRVRRGGLLRGRARLRARGRARGARCARLRRALRRRRDRRPRRPRGGDFARVDERGPEWGAGVALWGEVE